jgi:hypothetical protein
LLRKKKEAIASFHLHCVELEGFLVLQDEINFSTLFLLRKKKEAIASFHLHCVELEGFEPSSKQGITKLSTCLSCYWFSGGARKQAS